MPSNDTLKKYIACSSLLADTFLVIKVGLRLERLGKKKEKRVVRCRGRPRSNKGKCDKEVSMKGVANERQTDGGYSDYINIQKE